jgi:ADP-heptose:LPS heptosyltransferase
MSAAIECLHKQHPNKYLTDIETSCDSIYENNPHIIRHRSGRKIKMEYPLIHQSNQKNVHFIQGYCEFLEKQLDIKIECNVNRPFLYLSNEEKKWMNQVVETTGYKGNFWLICSGVKSDYTIKAWPFYQDVVDHYKGKITFVQVGEAHHNHKPLNGVINLIGKTTARQLIRLANKSVAGIGGVSFLHHIYAAFQKPFVCIASGMEPATWERYNTEAYLTMQGRLPCCLEGGCWRKKIVKENNIDKYCDYPIFNIASEPYPKCMTMISVENVINAIDSYYFGGILTY